MDHSPKKNKFIVNLPEYEGIGVYALVNNRNQKMYIGSSQNVRQRIIQHKSSPPSSVKEDIQRGDTFTVKILEMLPYGSNQFDMFSRETHFIQHYDTLNTGYNRAKTTCSTKEELLTSLEYFKNNSEMSNYIKNIISKRERPIYAKPNEKNTIRHIPIDAAFFSLVQKHAASMGESMNSFVIRAIDEAMERDNRRS